MSMVTPSITKGIIENLKTYKREVKICHPKNILLLGVQFERAIIRTNFNSFIHVCSIGPTWIQLGEKQAHDQYQINSTPCI